MPEGDTVHKLAAALRPILEGACLTAVTTRSARGESPVACGAMTVRTVEARGKHLLMDLDAENGRCWRLRTHLGMFGTWHQYAPGVAWSKPEHQAWAVLELPDRTLVCFHPRELQWHPRSQGTSAASSLERRVGPDLLAPEVDLEQVVQRIRSRSTPGRPLLDVLLDQSLAAGIGNVYKSEVLFLQGQPPLRPLETVANPELLGLYQEARRLLRRNLKPGPRITRERAETGAYLFVYGRRNKPCYHCGTPIHYGRLGEHHRATYWCPRCQPGNPTRVGHTNNKDTREEADHERDNP